MAFRRRPALGLIDRVNGGPGIGNDVRNCRLLTWMPAAALTPAAALLGLR